MILGSFVVEKHRHNKGLPTITRFTGNMVFQHLVLTAAFITLVITGFALKFPDAWWVWVLNVFGIHEQARSVIHRVAAVFLIYITVHHTLFVLFTRARQGGIAGTVAEFAGFQGS